VKYTRKRMRLKKSITFVATVLATLPLRTASQGGSFAFYTFLNNSLILRNELR
jgi:hypothetical protein